MHFSFTSRTHGDIEFLPIVPISLKEYYLNAPGVALYSSQTAFWQAMLQTIPLRGHQIYYGIAYATEEVVLETFCAVPSLVLRLVINGRITIESEQTGKRVISARHFSAAHYPGFLTVSLSKGIRHEVLEIHCSLEQVKELTYYYEGLHPYYEAMLAGKGVVLSAAPVRLPAEALILLRLIKRKYRKHELVRPFYYDNHAQSLLILLLDILLRKNSRPVPYALHNLEKVLHAQRIIEKEYMTDLTLNGVAGRVQMETYALKEGFRRVMDTNFSEYLLNVRMEKAIELLEERQMTLEEIGRQCGYSSPGGFRNAFLSYYGYTPGDYWKKNDNN